MQILFYVTTNPYPLAAPRRIPLKELQLLLLLYLFKTLQLTNTKTLELQLCCSYIDTYEYYIVCIFASDTKCLSTRVYAGVILRLCVYVCVKAFVTSSFCVKRNVNVNTAVKFISQLHNVQLDHIQSQPHACSYVCKFISLCIVNGCLQFQKHFFFINVHMCID